MSPAIEDKELRDLFRVESDEHLQRLDEGLLRLEASPDDAGALLDELQMEAHSLKGAARAVGLMAIQTLAHQFEDLLGAFRRGEATANPAVLAGLFAKVDVLRRLTQEATADETVIDRPPVAVHAPAAADVGTEIGSLEPAARIETKPAAPPAPFRVNTLRIEPDRLDALMTRAGELLVAKLRIGRLAAELDDVLAQCDDWARTAVPEAAPRLAQIQASLASLRQRAGEDGAQLAAIADQLEAGIRTLRLLPMSTLFSLFPRLVHDLALEQRKEVDIVIEGAETVADKRILEELKDPLTHLLRNAVDHGIEPPQQRERAGKPRVGTIRLKAHQSAGRMVIEVGDDGRGLDLDALKRAALRLGIQREETLNAMSVAETQQLALVSGLSTSAFVTDLSGRGVGLDVVRRRVEGLKGILEMESGAGQGLILRMRLPVSLATARVLILAAQGRHFAVPVDFVRFSRRVPAQAIYTVEGRPALSLDGITVSVAKLTDLLDRLPASTVLSQTQPMACTVLSVGGEPFGILSDEVVSESEVILKPPNALVRRVRHFSGAAILEDGEICLVLHPPDLLKSLRRLGTAAAALEPELPLEDGGEEKKLLLLVEDSITTRAQEKRILEGAGYEVVTAVDGLDALGKLGSRAFDAVVSDIMMPRMDGLALTAKIRADSRYCELPVILVTSLSTAEDQRRGLEAGANAYISKPGFDQRVLLDCLARLI